MPGVIDGRRWLRQRIEHLEEELRGNPPEEHRSQLEAELTTVRAELRHHGSWRRWLLWGSR